MPSASSASAHGAPGTALAADHVARPSADLLRHAVRDLGDGIQLEVQVRRPRPGLAAVVLEHLEVDRLVRWLGGGPELAHRVTHVAEELLGEMRAGVREPLVVVPRPDHDLPRPAPVWHILRQQLDLGVPFPASRDDLEDVRAQDDAANGIVVALWRVIAVAAMGALYRRGLHREGGVLEGAVGDDRRPPAGDRVAAKLEHAALPGGQPSSFSSQLRRRSCAAHSSRRSDMISTSSWRPRAKWRRRSVPSRLKPAFSYERRAARVAGVDLELDALQPQLAEPEVADGPQGIGAISLVPLAFLTNADPELGVAIDEVEVVETDRANRLVIGEPADHEVVVGLALGGDHVLEPLFLHRPVERGPNQEVAGRLAISEPADESVEVVPFGGAQVDQLTANGRRRTLGSVGARLIGVPPALGLPKGNPLFRRGYKEDRYR